MEKKELYKAIANHFNAMNNCKETNNTEWYEKHCDIIEELVKENLPSGSGFDSGTQFNYKESKDEKLVFNTAFHHMNDNGMYDGWTTHQVIVTPSLMFGYKLKVTGKNRNEIKDYISQCFII